jgi:AMP nucleosidase
MRATYPFVRIATTTYARVDSRLAYGFVAGPGVHETTVTRPDLYRGYFLEQIRLLLLVWTAPDGIKRARMRSL